MPNPLEEALARTEARVVHAPRAVLLDRVTAKANDAVGADPMRGGAKTCRSDVDPLPNVLWFVPKIEDIMKARGLEVGARFQRRWRDGEYNRISGKQSEGKGTAGPLAIETISIDWVLGFERGARLFDDIKHPSVFLSEKARKLLQRRIETVYSQTTGTDVDYGSFPDGLPRERLYINHVALDAYDGYSAGIDDLAAALGRFAMFVVPLASARLEDKDVVVTIPEIGIYVRDSFDFEGDQALGRWKPPDKVEMTKLGEDPSRDMHGDMRRLCPDEWVYMSNWIYRLYREDSAMGEDFLVYSDIKSVYFEPPKTFSFPAAGWILQRGR
jgi:hypothetical protein